jgi:hypothetical protein
MTNQLAVIPPKSKYKLGDYMTAIDRVFLQVMAVIPSDNPMYAIRIPMRPNSTKPEQLITWHSEFELDKFKMEKAEPDFSKWQTIEYGDIIYVKGSEGAGHSHHVLARVGNAVLLSMEPKSRKEQKAHVELQNQLDDLMQELEQHDQDVPGLKVIAKITKEATHKSDIDNLIDDMLTGQNAYKVAGEWWMIDQLALMNWELARE